jgi:site-specific DNA-methyltransferase (adenine-specific)
MSSHRRDGDVLGVGNGSGGVVLIDINRIYNEDCLDTMSRMPDNFVDMTVTSPPYNIGGKSMSVGKYYDKYSDDLNNLEYRNFLYTTIDNLLRISKYYVFFNFQILSGNKDVYLQLLSDFKSNIKDIIIWNKQAVAQIQKGKMATGYEFIIILGHDNKMKFDYNNFPDNNYVPNIQTWFKKESIKGHGATMPINMARYFIMNFSNRNDIIYDPFMGTGTTGCAAAIESRNWIGSEISTDYVDLANKRIDKYLNQTKLF